MCAPANADLVPVPGTGWNEDLVVEKETNFTWEAADADNSDGAAATSADVVGFVFYESGWAPDPGPGPATQGLNNTGIYSGGPSGATYQMPSYAGDNVFLNGGTFTLDTGTNFSDLAFLVTTQATTGLINWTATLNFSDASTTVLNGVGHDWINTDSTDVIVSGHGLAQLYAGFYEDNLFMVERSFELDPADQLKSVTSIDFALTGGDNVVIHAISGEVAAVPEPSAALLVGFIGSLCAIGHSQRKKKAAKKTAES